MVQQQTTTTVNGIDLETLQGTIDALRLEPELGTCKFRARNQWIRGGRNRGMIEDYYAVGGERTHPTTFEIDADEPPLLAGGDQAPNPLEHLLNSLAGCVTTSMVAHAAVRGIQIEELESEVEGDLDLRGFLGLSEETPKGYTNIRVKVKVKADVDNMERLRRLAEYSPTYNTVIHGVNVDLQIEPK